MQKPHVYQQGWMCGFCMKGNLFYSMKIYDIISKNHWIHACIICNCTILLEEGSCELHGTVEKANRNFIQK